MIVLSVGQLQLAGFLTESEVGMTGRLWTASKHCGLTTPPTGRLWAAAAPVSVQSGQAGRDELRRPTSTCAPERRTHPGIFYGPIPHGICGTISATKGDSRIKAGGSSVCRVHTFSPSLSLAPVAAQQAGETVGACSCLLLKVVRLRLPAFFHFPQLVNLSGWADGKQARSCAYELPVGHIPAACTAIPPHAPLCPQNQVSGRKRGDEELGSGNDYSQEHKTVPACA